MFAIVLAIALSFMPVTAYQTETVAPYVIQLPECVNSETVPCANRDEGNDWRVIFEYAPNGSPLRYAPITPQN